MIVIIDYKTGNTGSLLNMLKKIGAEAIISSEISEIKKADKLILPGVGAFDAGMINLNNSGFLEVINKKVIIDKTPILGICLGMQLFAKESEEGELKGLGWIDAKTIRFRFDETKILNNLKIPHMGWNTIDIHKNNLLFKGMPEESKFYFVHSFHLLCNNKEDILATTNYGYDFASIIRRNNIIGAQFHPEKSHKYGMKLLKNFAELC